MSEDGSGPAPTVTPLSMLTRKLKSTASLSGDDHSAVETLPFVLRTYAERTSIVREGDVPKQCCLILDGWAYRCSSLDNGQRQISAFYVPGDIPDIESLHLQVMDQGLVAMPQATVAFIPHNAMRALIKQNESVATALWRDTLIDGTRCRELVTSLGRRQANSRLAHLFCEMYVRLQAVGLAEDLAYKLPTTQTDLADALGISAVHLNRSLQDLRKQGLITFRGRVLTIHDWNGLAKAARFDPAYLHIVRRAGE